MHDDAKWILGLILVFGVLWIAGRGPSHPERSAGPFIFPLPPVSTGEVYGPDFFLRRMGVTLEPSGTSRGEVISPPDSGSFLGEKLQKIEEAVGNDSPLKGKLRLSYVSVSGDDPDAEYISISAEYGTGQKVSIAGLSIESAVTGRRISIPAGTYLPQQGTLNVEEPIFLEPGSVAYIITGRSPIGYSFRLNRCTGYFEQFQDFTPSLPIECPNPGDEPLPESIDRSDDACFDYLDNLGNFGTACQIVPDPPEDLSPTCREYVREKVSYPECVKNHKGDADFYRGEWRVYLKRDARLWKDRRETLRLLDRDNRLIDTVTY